MMSARGRRGRGRVRPAACGRWAAAGRPITPSAARRSSVAVVVRPSSRATGTPRSVITTSSPPRARSSHSLRCARRSVTATSMPQSYTLATTDLYGNLRTIPSAGRVSCPSIAAPPNRARQCSSTRFRSWRYLSWAFRPLRVSRASWARLPAESGPSSAAAIPPSADIGDRRHYAVGQVPGVHEQRPGHLADLEPPGGQQLLAVAPSAHLVLPEAPADGPAKPPGVAAVALPRRQPRAQVLVAVQHGPVHQPLGDLARRVDDKGQLGGTGDAMHPALAAASVATGRVVNAG